VGRAVLRRRRRRREGQSTSLVRKAVVGCHRRYADALESPPGGRQRSALPPLSWRYVEAFEAEAAQLYSQAMDLDEMRQFATRFGRR
jgi:hypothetical protein